MKKSDGTHEGNELQVLAQYLDSTSLADMESTEVPVEPARYPMVSRSIRIEQPVMAEIRSAAKRLGIPVTQLMRQWIHEGLAKERGDRTEGVTETGTSAVQPHLHLGHQISEPSASQLHRAAHMLEVPHAAPPQAALGLRIKQQVRRARNAQKSRSSEWLGSLRRGR